MEFKKVQIKIEKGQTITSLYHSPFDLNLFYLICLAKTGLKIRIVLDDVDNIGIDRGEKASPYALKEKYFFSKTERTNVRPLSLLLPKNLLANLATPSLKEFDALVGIRNLKDELRYNDTVEHWIQDTTRQLGIYSIVGPDRAFAFLRVDEQFNKAVQSARQHMKEILSRISPNGDKAIKFIDWLLGESISGITISDYYKRILDKIIEYFDLQENVWVEKMSDVSIQEKNRLILDEFMNDAGLRDLYTRALDIDGKKDFDDLPFYSISKKDGERLLPIKNYIDNPTQYLIAPKVLMLNNFENLILPYHAIDKSNIFARELMYSHNKLHCNQVFCDDKWQKWLASFDIRINLNEIESYFYNETSVDQSIFSDSTKLETLTERKLEEKYKQWVVDSTRKAVKQFKYPLLFLALLQDKIFYREIPDFYRLIIEQ